MSGEGILLEHEIERRVNFIRRKLPRDQRAFGEIRGHERLAHAADRAGAQHRSNSFDHGLDVNAGTLGNLADNPKTFLFLIDYAHRQRVKIWGTARVVEAAADLTAKLMPDGYRARAEQVILFTVSAWNANCAQHIPQRFDAADVAAALAARDRRIEALEMEVKRLRGEA